MRGRWLQAKRKKMYYQKAILIKIILVLLIQVNIIGFQKIKISNSINSQNYLVEGFQIIKHLFDWKKTIDYKLKSDKKSNYKVNGEINDKENDLIEILNIVLNNSNLVKYYHFENKELNRKAIICKHRQFSKKIEDKVQIQNLPVSIIPKKEIEQNFFIEFAYIKINKSNAKVKLSIEAEGLTSWVNLENKEGHWIITQDKIIEK